MHIISFYVANEKSHITRFQELQHYKQTRKGVILDYSENIKSYITSLQNKSSAVIESTIHCSSKSITSSNDMSSSLITGFTYASNITSESNSIGFSNGSLVFGIDSNDQELISSNDTCLKISIADIIISEGLPFNIYRKLIFKKALELSRNVPKTYIPPNINTIPKEPLDVIHGQNTKSNSATIKKEAEIFGLLFLGDVSTI